MQSQMQLQLQNTVSMDSGGHWSGLRLTAKSSLHQLPVCTTANPPNVLGVRHGTPNVSMATSRPRLCSLFSQRMHIIAIDVSCG